MSSLQKGDRIGSDAPRNKFENSNKGHLRNNKLSTIISNAEIDNSDEESNMTAEHHSNIGRLHSNGETNTNSDESDNNSSPETSSKLQDSFERFKPKLTGSSSESNIARLGANHVYVSPRISARSKHVIRDSRDEEPLPTAQRNRLEV